METKKYSTYGKVVTLDAYGIDPNILDDLIYIIKLGKEAIEKSGATEVSFQSKKFEPQGVTVVFLLEESHLSFHTSPESGFASVDMYTCGHICDPNIAIEYIVEKLKPDMNRVYIKSFIRGVE